MSLGCKLKPKTFCISGLYPSLAPPRIPLKKSHFERYPPPVGVERSGGSAPVLSASSHIAPISRSCRGGFTNSFKGCREVK
jgi:hypothetical protein